MNLLWPKIDAEQLPTMLRIAGLGALVAGAYGAIHDQISYAISPEYFTQMKFVQFAWADVRLPPRAFASEIGFLGTWGIGLCAGWFLARSGLAAAAAHVRGPLIARSFAIMTAATAAIGLIGALAGIVEARRNPAAWNEVRYALDLTDVPAFIVVAYLHGAGYFGALVGLLLAILYVRPVVRSRHPCDVVG